MIFSLVLKDLLVARYRGLLTLCLALVFPLGVFAKTDASGKYVALCVGTVFLTTSMFVMQAGIWEEKSRGDVLLQVLPVSRRQVVASRYLLVAAMAAGLAAGYAAILAAFTGMQPPVDAALLARCIALAIPLPILFLGLALPFGYRYGITRVQAVFTVAMFLPVFLISAVTRLIRRAGPETLAAIRAVVGLPPLTQIGLALGIAALIAAVSYSVSVRLYERRDF